MESVERRSRALKVMLCVLLVAVPVLVSGSLGHDSEDGIGVVVTIIPLQEIVKEIGGSSVRVTPLLQPGSTPHAFDPEPGQFIAVAKAEAYFYLGSGIEFEMVNMDALIQQNSKMLLVNCSEGVSLKTWSEHLHGGDEHDDGGVDHDHGIYDPHIWLSPTNMMIIAQNVYKGLVKIDPENQECYEENLGRYLQHLGELDGEIREILATHEGKPFLVYHPSWGYFCDDYGLRQIAIEKEAEELTPRGLAEIITMANGEGIRVIVVSPLEDDTNARIIADEIDGSVVDADPLTSVFGYGKTLLRLAKDLAGGFAV